MLFRSGESSHKKAKTVALRAATTPVPAVTAPTPHTQTQKHPFCTKCRKPHAGECWVCSKCKKNGHTASHCREKETTGISRECYGCGKPGHLRRNCPEEKKTGNHGRIMAMGAGEALQDPRVVTGTFLINNSYAFVLFDCGAEKSFVSHKYKKNLNQIGRASCRERVLRLV